jgi:uncharacterized protein YbjT (DUF2867 family)
MSKTTIFYTGATGYIGGAVLEKLIGDEAFAITALVRNADKARKLNDLGIETIVASLQDHDTLTTAAANAEVTIHTVGTYDSILDSRPNVTSSG